MTDSYALVLLIASLLIAPQTARAQEGTVRYDVSTEMDFDGMDVSPELEPLLAQLGSTTTTGRVLRFDATRALTSAAAAASNEQELPADPDRPNTRVVVKRGGGRSDTFVDRTTETVIQTQHVLGRQFRIVEERRPLTWQITGEEAEFLGYPCQKAIAVRDDVEIEAWFTTQIPVPAGPETYGDLPGLILVLTAGRETYEAVEVDLIPLDTPIMPPTDGQEVSREEFAQLVEERLRDLETSTFDGSRGGRGSGSVRIIRRRN